MHLEKLAEGLKEPGFKIGPIRDYNPVSGQLKIRTLHMPNDEMRILQNRLIRYIRSLVKQLPYATGGRPGSEPLKHLRPHLKNRFIFHIDLKDAYPNVTGVELAKLLCQLDPALAGEEEVVYQFLVKYSLTAKGGLATGPNAAPDLFNLYCAFMLDEKVATLCQHYGLPYTRYLDDLTISAPEPIGKVKRSKICRTVKEAGFQIHPRKTRNLDLKKGPVVICGIGLEYGGRMFVPRHWTKGLRGLLHMAMQYPKELKPRVEGMMGLFRHITNPPYNKTEKAIFEAYANFRHLWKIRYGRRPKKR